MDEPERTIATEQMVAAPSLEPPGVRSPCLIALRGPQKGANFELRAGESVLGRSSDQADIVLLGPGISRAHARVTVDEGQVKVVDLGSTNGIFVRGERVDGATLEAGDTLALGHVVLLRLEWSDTQLREVLHDLYEGATNDSLTGILNRRSLLHRLSEEYAASKRHSYPSCLVVLDIDHFKSINDTHGHPAGDAVLVQFSRFLAEKIRTEDVLGRYGGEEFVILLRHTSRDNGFVSVDRIREEISKLPFVVPTPAGDVTLQVTFSAGLADFPLEDGVEGSVQAADKALYRAKRGGRNRVCPRQEDSGPQE